MVRVQGMSSVVFSNDRRHSASFAASVSAFIFLVSISKRMFLLGIIDHVVQRKCAKCSELHFNGGVVDWAGSPPTQGPGNHPQRTCR